MKRKVWIIMIAVVALLAILFVPIPSGTAKDGGTRVYSALTYKIVDWNHLYDDGTFDKTKVYFGSDRWKSLDELFLKESETIENVVRGEIVEIRGVSALIEPIEGEWERSCSDRISFSIQGFEEIGAKEGSIVEVTYRGGVMESYPAQIFATGWRMIEQSPKKAREI